MVAKVYSQHIVFLGEETKILFGHSPSTSFARKEKLSCIPRDSLPGVLLRHLSVIISGWRGKRLVYQRYILTRIVERLTLLLTLAFYNAIASFRGHQQHATIPNRLGYTVGAEPRRYLIGFFVGKPWLSF